MPGKHYNGSPKKGFDFKSEKPKNKKNYNKLTTSQAEKISEQVTMSAIKGGMPRGIGNYEGSGSFAMKNKVLAKSARYGEPMQKNYEGIPNTFEKVKNTVRNTANKAANAASKIINKIDAVTSYSDSASNLKTNRKTDYGK